MSSLPPTLQSLRGKTAVVTGGSRGIGAQIAYELAKRGAQVAVTYTSRGSGHRLQDLQDRISSLPIIARVEFFRGDLRDPTAPASIIEQITERFGPQIDILINNAACMFNRPAAELTASDFAHVYDLNVRGVVLMTAAVIPHLPPWVAVLSTSAPSAGD
ncbi:hypothetical protein G7Y79_00032g067290 [Physcia stellaris]|nr:hypothetical protein G7Y79_00032g067290 [Physcia stellaris]